MEEEHDISKQNQMANSQNWKFQQPEVMHQLINELNAQNGSRQSQIIAILTKINVAMINY